MLQLTMLKGKIHHATVTEARLDYEGSISIDPALYTAAGMLPFEQVDVLNCTNGQRFTTYVIEGKPGEIGVNGAAARLVQKGDRVIVLCYAGMDEQTARNYQPKLVFVDARNAQKTLEN